MSAIPTIGQPWPEHGGVYIGSRLVAGQVQHIIIPGGPEQDIVASHNNAAERIAERGEINGHTDWRHGSQEDVMLAYINVPHLFPRKGMESVQVTSTPYDSRDAWVVGFEDGRVGVLHRTSEWRVRPFRSVIA